jgi:hypothetical protein
MYPTTLKGKTSGILKKILYAVTLTVFLSFCFIYNHHSAIPEKNKEIVIIQEEIQQKGTSAIALTSLPFVLAIKHLIIDREE